MKNSTALEGSDMILNDAKYGYAHMVLLSIKTAPIYSLIFAIRTIFSALLPTITVFITARFINTAISIYNGTSHISEIYISLALLGFVFVYSIVTESIFDLIDWKRYFKFRKKLMPEIIEKRASLSYKHIEDSDTLDLITRVGDNFVYNVWAMYSQVLGLFWLAIYLLGILGTVFFQIWWIAALMICASIPMIYFANRAGKNTYTADQELTELDRRVGYLSYILMSRNTVNERLIFRYSDRINQNFKEKSDFARKERLKVYTKNMFRSKIGGLLMTIYALLCIIMLLGSTLSGVLDIGMFIALSGAVLGLSGQLSWGINDQMSNISYYKEYLTELTEFVSLESDKEVIAAHEKNSHFSRLEFINVSFSYPGTTKKVLNKCSFVIEKGKHYSLIGENGSGKSTIIKIILGIYNDYEGKVLIDGKDMRTLSKLQIKSLFSSMFQDFFIYNMSIFDNITLGIPNNDTSQTAVEHMLKLVGLDKKINMLEQGMHTPLGKVLESGVDFSGGEFQRIALVRTLIREQPVCILDEPTSHLDPISEGKLYHDFAELIKDKTSIFISHRLGSTRLSDIIYVLSEGNVVECGHHDALMKKRGQYYDMFTTQATWYSNGDEIENG